MNTGPDKLPITIRSLRKALAILHASIEGILAFMMLPAAYAGLTMWPVWPSQLALFGGHMLYAHHRVCGLI